MLRCFSCRFVLLRLLCLCLNCCARSAWFTVLLLFLLCCYSACLIAVRTAVPLLGLLCSGCRLLLYCSGCCATARSAYLLIRLPYCISACDGSSQTASFLLCCCLKLLCYCLVYLCCCLGCLTADQGCCAAAALLVCLSGCLTVDWAAWRVLAAWLLIGCVEGAQAVLLLLGCCGPVRASSEPLVCCAAARAVALLYGPLRLCPVC